MISDCVLVGGFLGAGKTTALLRMAEHFLSRGRRVGLITNDQGGDLVDTRVVSSRSLPVEEVIGGCFCCRFDSLVSAVTRLARDAEPHVVLAEPVGSCTDVRATVLYPLARLHGHEFRMAPLSVLVDPVRAAGALGLEAHQGFSPDVQYIYNKQLEEADLIVVNKCDLLDGARRERLVAAMHARHPQARVLTVSARTGENLEAWFDQLSTPLASRPGIDVDYDRYAAGEARLGWLNGRWRLAADAPFDGNALVIRLARRVARTLGESHVPLAHLKASLTGDGEAGLAAVSVVDEAREPGVVSRLVGRLGTGELVLNLRAEGDPVGLAAVVADAIRRATAHSGVTARLEHGEEFRPGRPVPTYRLQQP